MSVWIATNHDMVDSARPPLMGLMIMAEVPVEVAHNLMPCLTLCSPPGGRHGGLGHAHDHGPDVLALQRGRQHLRAPAALGAYPGRDHPEGACPHPLASSSMLFVPGSWQSRS